ncbi:carbonic anhydrase 14-like [Belonocnema kinseyi]|uniref:carbonic anhydrase 14-like n=1 Tax=Belonocnema kinseyi TaxID=2817044 RepID=UPI00143CD7B8|nr:carbonic anhydrase 14-like [Belonocnema kinseyi]
MTRRESWSHTWRVTGKPSVADAPGNMQRFEMNKLRLIATILFSFILGATAFSYKEAKNWGKKYPQCNGEFQSPISFVEPIAGQGFPEINEPLKRTDFDQLPKKITMKNTGHTVEIKAEWSGKPPRFTGGPLHSEYVFEKATFHWTQKKSGMGPGPSYYDIIEKNVHKVESINSSAVIPSFPIASIFNDKRQRFLFYEGSLEYPPCYESVTWFEDNIFSPISDALLRGFRKVKLAEGDLSNIRPLQELNNRQVKTVSNLQNM